MDEFTLSFIVCAASVLVLALSGTATPLFALTLFAISQAGYFIFLQLRKALVAGPWAAALLVIASFACFFISALLFSATSSFLALVFVPALFCLPSIAAVAHEVFISG
ncbi:MAG: hypothetical protein WC861_00745 [Candidatus Micrarchaeia archaeon]|jgi:hypothetical protein